MLIIDFETRSTFDLPTCGPYLYAEHYTTGIICMAWMDTETGDEGVWFPGDTPPPGLIAYLEGDGLVAAWNAQFDRLIYDHCEHPFPDVAFNRWYCLSAEARVNAMPAGLADCSRAIFGKSRKDIRGRQLIDALSKPQADGSFNRDPMLIEEMGAYCLQDVRASFDCHVHLREMSQTEHMDYLVNERINDNGVCIDRSMAMKAQQYAAAELQDLSLELSELTGGVVTKPTQTARMREWVYKHVDQPVQNLMTVTKNGKTTRSLDKRVRENILAAADDNAIEVPDRVYDAIMCMHEGSNTSVAKFKRMLERASHNTDRVHGSFLHFGALQTGRYASRGLQLHNFRRDGFSHGKVMNLRETMMRGGKLQNTMDTLSRLLRSAIIPASPRERFVVSDWKAIEARVLPWLTHDHRADNRLAIFAEDGDIYAQTALQIGQTDRQVGKVADLSLGYAGGAGAFEAMARNYGVALTTHEVSRTVQNWRLANPWAVEFWDELERAAKLAVMNAGQVFFAGRVQYIFIEKLLGGTLVCTLPDGSHIQYPYCRVDTVDTKFGPRPQLSSLKANWKPAWNDKEWPRVRLWRGLLAENVTQATAAALLRDSLRELHMGGLDVVAHVHDEIIVECSKDDVPDVIEFMKAVMLEPPDWAEGLPLHVDIKEMSRYGK